MKNMKKFTAMLLAVIMVLGMAMSASAAKITIDDGKITGATYQAYKLLKATDGGVNEDGTKKIAYTVNEKYAAVLEEVTGKTTDAEVVAYINEHELSEFAEDIYAAINTAGLEKDYESEENMFASVEQGYYLIVETALGTTESGATDTYSLLMLDTAGKDDVTVYTKEDLPTVEKKVEEKNDTTGDTSWGDRADYDIGDVINYKITGTVSDKYENYKSYYYSFGDTMDAGLTYNDDAKVYVVNGESKENVTAQFNITKTTDGFTATANLKDLQGVTITENTTIVVEYSAKLNENAKSGDEGNKNEVVLKYENNPYHEKDDIPEVPGETPKDINIVFTFDTIVNKVDKEGKALEGAGFTLYKFVQGEWTQVGGKITDVTTFRFDGLDVGKYKLEETEVPAGYNKAADIEFEVVAEYNDEIDPPALTRLQVKNKEGAVISEGEEASFKATVSNGEVSTNVVNYAGAELPSTGGIGTTMFYVAGAALVLAAVVLLVTKRRMRAE